MRHPGVPNAKVGNGGTCRRRRGKDGAILERRRGGRNVGPLFPS